MRFNPAGVFASLQTEVADLCADSRRIQSVGGKGRKTAFLAYPGESGDGRNHIAGAIANGAAAVLWEPEGYQWQKRNNIANTPVPKLRERAGKLADFIYRKPSAEMFVAAVTGTNGKTTTAWFAAQLMREKKAAVIGTLGAGTPGQKLTPTATTTPDCAETHRLLRKFADRGVQAVVVEASSHGIAQNRLAEVRVDCAAMLNVGRDHLDYHGSEKNYRAAKSRLLLRPELKTAILGGDDGCCRAFSQKIKAPQMFFGKNGAQMRLLNLRAGKNGRAIAETDGVCGRIRFSVPLAGAHNAGNFLAAALIARCAGMSCGEMAAAAKTVAPPPGRMQRIGEAKNGPAVFADYAHTPEALAAALSALSAARKYRRVILVCGCGGERDKGKREMMGAIAREADVFFLTDDNPRGEDAKAIRAEIAAGFNKECARMNKRGELREIASRARAITLAINEARGEDAVLIAGKGHEQYQEMRGRKIPFSDCKHALAALRAKTKRGTR